MSIQWHHDAHPVIARNVHRPAPGGRLQVRFRGPGQYLFYVDHSPHDHRLLTTFTMRPRVMAYAPNGRMITELQTRPNRFGDRNALVWAVQNGAGTGWFEV